VNRVRGRTTGREQSGRVPFPSPVMPTPEYKTTDIYLSSFLCHRSARLTRLKRVGPKKVEFRFEADSALHDLLRLYWSGTLTPVVPWELFQCLHRLRCLSITRPK